ncbi:hypothetical protein [Thermomonospora curvata]|uniref:Uncharacterized protein n=1 Tax=Thermomonospora curvata (strain ATCC 19995 / DSM 43183 / JCM 3096 / KCTC 9072 / NBRC 15933 / NCIMB 10081 / Henssen B9) TaxID=471852 RepID=D1A8F4_THECD|nr:hypothetical protein [Thermomonospora curvata]ACZ00469.1 hypothetical protein Tcur_4953 [Thermomonospora curvata DSM 43183]
MTGAPAPGTTRLPLGVQADGTLTPRAVPIAFVLGTLAVFAALPLGVLGIVLNDRGLERVRTDPQSARKLVAWSWGIFAVVDALAVVAVVLAVFLL